jgi:hypothetical protein
MPQKPDLLKNMVLTVKINAHTFTAFFNYLNKYHMFRVILSTSKRSNVPTPTYALNGLRHF